MSRSSGDVGTRVVSLIYVPTGANPSTQNGYRASPCEAGQSATTMVAPIDTLPTSNEEYGTKEYWCAPNVSVFVLFSSSFFRDQRYAQ